MKGKRFFSVLMGACLAGGMLFASACGGNTGKVGVLRIDAFEGGGGGTYAQALADAYRKYNPEVAVEVNCNPLVPEEAPTALESKSSPTDVYMLNGLNIGSLCENADGALEPLNDVYESKPKTDKEQGAKTIEELISAPILPSMKYGGDREPYAGNYYALPVGSNPHSLIINKTCMDSLFGADQWEVPRTSAELIALCDAIKNKNAKVNVAGTEYDVYSFIYAGNALEYWRYMWYPWVAQYDGSDVYTEALSCKIDGEYNKDAPFSAGKEEALSELETILKRANGYCHPDSMSNKHTTVQKYFMQGRAAMMVSGDWIETETDTEYHPDLMMVRSPILSALGKKLGLTDAKLSAAVKAVDENAAAPEGVSEEIFSKVREARKIVFTLANTQIAVVPSTSVNKEIAKDFLRFLYSKEGFDVYAKETGGARLPVNDYQLDASLVASMTTFGKSIKEIAEGDTEYIFTGSSDPIRYRAGMSEFLRSEKPELSLAKKSNPLTAKEILEKEKELVYSNWNTYMSMVS